MLNNIKFTLLKFKPGIYWSKLAHKYMYMDNISYIIWEGPDVPVKTEIVNLTASIAAFNAISDTVNSFAQIQFYT